MSKYKFGKQKKTLAPEEFKEVMQEGYFEKEIHKGFIVLLYYLGCRVSELTGMPERKSQSKKHPDRILQAHPAPTPDAFDWQDEYVDCNIPPCKHGVTRPPFRLSFHLPFIEDVRVAWDIARKRKTVMFPFSRQEGWLIVKRVLPHHYPHFFRLNRCVNHLNDATNSLNDIRVWFGWNSLDTVNNYLGHSKRVITKLSEGLE